MWSADLVGFDRTKDEALELSQSFRALESMYIREMFSLCRLLSIHLIKLKSRLTEGYVHRQSLGASASQVSSFR